MARTPSLEKLTHAELLELRDEVELLIAAKKSEAKAELREKFTVMARAQGFDVGELMGKPGRHYGKVAVKYRDPENPANTWTGRGRMPLWMVAATKRRGVKKDDFLA